MHDITPRDVSFPNPKCNILMPFKIKMASCGESHGLKIQVVSLAVGLIVNLSQLKL